MSNSNRNQLLIKGKSLGITILVTIQLIIGVVHLILGFWLLANSIELFTSRTLGNFETQIYSIYTILFGLLTMVLSFGLWLQKLWGWVGTLAVLLFVITADFLTLMSLPSIPGIPKFAGYGEISYGVLVIAYLLQGNIRAKYRKR